VRWCVMVCVCVDEPNSVQQEKKRRNNAKKSAKHKPKIKTKKKQASKYFSAWAGQRKAQTAEYPCLKKWKAIKVINERGRKERKVAKPKANQKNQCPFCGIIRCVYVICTKAAKSNNNKGNSHVTHKNQRTHTQTQSNTAGPLKHTHTHTNSCKLTTWDTNWSWRNIFAQQSCYTGKKESRVVPNCGWKYWGCISYQQSC